MNEEEQSIRDAIDMGMLELAAAEDRLQSEEANIRRIKEYLDALEDQLLLTIERNNV